MHLFRGWNCLCLFSNLPVDRLTYIVTISHIRWNELDLNCNFRCTLDIHILDKNMSWNDQKECFYFDCGHRWRKIETTIKTAVFLLVTLNMTSSFWFLNTGKQKKYLKCAAFLKSLHNFQKCFQGKSLSCATFYLMLPNMWRHWLCRHHLH